MLLLQTEIFNFITKPAQPNHCQYLSNSNQSLFHIPCSDTISILSVLTYILFTARKHWLISFNFSRNTFNHYMNYNIHYTVSAKKKNSPFLEVLQF